MIGDDLLLAIYLFGAEYVACDVICSLVLKIEHLSDKYVIFYYLFFNVFKIFYWNDDDASRGNCL